jgi:hypothetical protein
VGGCKRGGGGRWRVLVRFHRGLLLLLGDGVDGVGSGVSGGGGGGGGGGVEVEVAEIGECMACHDHMAGQLEFALGPDLLLDERYPMANVMKFGQAVQLGRLPVILIGSV